MSIDKDWSYTWTKNGLTLTATIGGYVWMYQKDFIDCLIVKDQHGTETRPDCRFFMDTNSPGDLTGFTEGCKFNKVTCKVCNEQMIQQEKLEYRNLNECEKCWKKAFKIETDAQQAEYAKEDEAEIQRMKAKGYKFRVDAWVHPADGGDDEEVKFFTADRPTETEIKNLLLKEGSCVFNDYNIKEL